VGREVDVDQLVSARIIVERLGFRGVSRVHYYWRSDETFPEPVFSLTEGTGGVRLWYWPDIETWWAQRQARRQGAPPSSEPED
jgi:hypothetical protein